MYVHIVHIYIYIYIYSFIYLLMYFCIYKHIIMPIMAILAILIMISESRSKLWPAEHTACFCLDLLVAMQES